MSKTLAQITWAILGLLFMAVTFAGCQMPDPTQKLEAIAVLLGLIGLTLAVRFSTNS